MASDNRRYLALRKKLDNLSLMMHLDEGSVPLVEKVLADLAKISQQYHTLMKKQQSLQQQQTSTTRTSENDKQSDYKFDLLNKQYHQLLEQNGRLKGQLLSKNSLGNEQSDRRIKAIRDKYDSKIAELTQKIRQFEQQEVNVGGDRQELVDRIDGLLEENHQLSQANKKTERMYVEALQQCDGLKMQLKQTSECESTAERGKAQELENILLKKNGQIQTMEENELILKAKIKALTRQLEAADGDKRRSMLESKSVMAISQALKSENRELEKSNSRLISEMEQLNHQLDVLRKTKSHLESQLYRHKEQQVNSLSSNQSTQLAKTRLEMLHDNLQQELLKRKQEIDDLKYQLEQQQKDSQRQQEKIRELNSKNAMLLKNINELQTQLDLVSGKFSAKLRENRELDTSKGLLERQVRQLESFRQQYQQLQLTLKQRQQNDEHLHHNDSKQRKNIEVQGRIYEEEIAIMRQNEQALVIRNEKLQSELKRLEMVVGSGNKQLELISSQKEALMHQIGELRETLNLTKNSDHSSKTSTIKLQERLNSMEILNQDLRSTLQEESHKVKQLTEEILRLQSELKQKDAKASLIFTENVQLSQRCETLESTKCELFEKLKMLSNQRSETEEDRLAYSQEVRNLTNHIGQLELELQRKNNAMLTIDEERDSMQHVLDEKTEENAQLKMRVEELESALKKYNRELDTRDLSRQGLQTRLTAMEDENSQLRKHLERAQNDLQSKMLAFSKMETHLNALTNEREIIILGHKDTQQEVARLTAAYKELEKRFIERTKEYDQSRENEQHMRLTHDEMLGNLQERSAQISRLEGIVKELEEANNQMYTLLHDRDYTMNEQNQMIMLAEQQNTQYMNEIASYERQLGLLNSQLVIKDGELRKLAAERDNYRLEPSRMRQPNELRAVFEEQLSILQNQLELKRRECELLTQQKRELEKVIESERTNNFVLARELNQQRTPIRAIMGQSLMDSGMENSSFHANSIGRPEIHMQDSFESHGSICSRKLKERIQRIEEQYANTHIRPKK